jgi:hypothetical protein
VGGEEGAVGTHLSLKLEVFLMFPQPRKDQMGKSFPITTVTSAWGGSNMNKKSGQPEELVSCADCGRSGECGPFLHCVPADQEGFHLHFSCHLVVVGWDSGVVMTLSGEGLCLAVPWGGHYFVCVAVVSSEVE